MERRRRKQRPDGAGGKNALPAKLGGQRRRCPNCKHELTLDEVFFVEEGGYSAHQVGTDGNYLTFEFYEAGGSDYAYFTCRNCGEPLDELTRLWRLDEEREILRRLK